jgi:hypothetical protein
VEGCADDRRQESHHGCADVGVGRRRSGTVLTSFRGAEGRGDPVAGRFAQGAGFVAWAGEGLTMILRLAVSLCGDSALAYKLGVWRRGMENVKHSVAGEVAPYHERTGDEQRRLDDRLLAIERYNASAIDQRVAIERRQSKVDATLETIHGLLARPVGAAGNTFVAYIRCHSGNSPKILRRVLGRGAHGVQGTRLASEPREAHDTQPIITEIA